MDIIIIVVLVFFGIRGWRKGFFFSFFSLVAFLLSIILALKLCGYGAEILQGVGFLNDFAENKLAKLFDKKLLGDFSNTKQLLEFVAIKQPLLYFFISKLITPIEIDGNLTSGEILGDTVASLFFTVISFLILFIVFYLLLSLLKSVILKLIRKSALQGVDRCIGSFFGLIKAFVFVLLLMLILTVFSNLLLQESILRFVTSGKVSGFLYKNVVEKIIDLIV